MKGGKGKGKRKGKEKGQKKKKKKKKRALLGERRIQEDELGISGAVHH